MAGAAALTLGGLLGALWLGSWAFDMRRYAQHVGRLERLLQKQPPLPLVVQAFEEEGTPLVGKADSLAELRDLAARLAPARDAEVLEKGRPWARTRVFRAPDMLYFIFFDGEDVMRGFVCVSA
jgi:hypothetical protein